MRVVPEARFQLHPSRILAFLLLVMAAAISAVICLLPLAWSVRAIVGVAVMLLIAMRLRRDAWLQARTSCMALRISRSGRILLWLRDGRELGGQVCGDTLVLPWLVVLNVKSDLGARHSVLILPDSMANEAFRRLRVMLRHGAKSYA